MRQLVLSELLPFSREGQARDNGVPFASPRALFGFSKLAVWWLRLGIHIERIKPGHPTQNGLHERMHLTVGTKQVGDKIWLVSLMDYDSGFFDQETTRLEPTANPFEAKVLPMCPE